MALEKHDLIYTEGDLFRVVCVATIFWGTLLTLAVWYQHEIHELSKSKTRHNAEMCVKLELKNCTREEVENAITYRNERDSKDKQ